MHARSYRVGSTSWFYGKKLNTLWVMLIVVCLNGYVYYQCTVDWIVFNVSFVGKTVTLMMHPFGLLSLDITQVCASFTIHLYYNRPANSICSVQIFIIYLCILWNLRGIFNWCMTINLIIQVIFEFIAFERSFWKYVRDI